MSLKPPRLLLLPSCSSLLQLNKIPSLLNILCYTAAPYNLTKYMCWNYYFKKLEALQATYLLIKRTTTTGKRDHKVTEHLLQLPHILRVFKGTSKSNQHGSSGVKHLIHRIRSLCHARGECKLFVREQPDSRLFFFFFS